MKKLLLSIITLFAINANGQTSVYHPFPDSAATWSVRYDGYESPECYDRLYYISGDTSINSITYHKISYFGWNGFDNTSTHLCDYWHYISNVQYLGAIRQDTSLKQVYFIMSGDSVEALLYDFSLQVGNRLHTYNSKLGLPNTVYVQSIDSILIGNSYRKRFNITTQFNPTSIIEGIGSITGLIEDLTEVDNGGTLDCFSQNNKQLYPDTMNTCVLLLGINKLDIDAVSISISPNPFHTVSLLKVGEVFEKAELKIYNLMGMQVNKQTIINQSAIINREGLSDGIYFYQVRNVVGKMLTGKFIVE